MSTPKIAPKFLIPLIRGDVLQEQIQYAKAHYRTEYLVDAVHCCVAEMWWHLDDNTPQAQATARQAIEFYNALPPARHERGITTIQATPDELRICRTVAPKLQAIADTHTHGRIGKRKQSHAPSVHVVCNIALIYASLKGQK